MTPYFILVSLSLSDWDKLDVNAFRLVLQKGQSYVRGVAATWIIKTTSPIDVWFRRFEPLLPDDSQIFIAKLDLTQRQGLLPRPPGIGSTARCPCHFHLICRSCRPREIPSRASSSGFDVPIRTIAISIAGLTDSLATVS